MTRHDTLAFEALMLDNEYRESVVFKRRTQLRESLKHLMRCLGLHESQYEVTERRRDGRYLGFAVSAELIRVQCDYGLPHFFWQPRSAENAEWPESWNTASWRTLVYAESFAKDLFTAIGRHIGQVADQKYSPTLVAELLSDASPPPITFFTSRRR
jgi:hypothetical protein